jgi:hypothetical protein
MAGIAPFIQLGSGLLFVNPNGSNLAANVTPFRPWTIQDFELTVKGKIQKLQGQYNTAEDIARVDQDWAFKFTMGRVDFFALNQMFYSDVSAGGGHVVNAIFQATVPATPGPYTLTIAPPSSGTFYADLGVEYTGAFTGRFIKGAPSATAGIYSVVPSTGVYTFASADQGASIQISYSYTIASTPGTGYQANGQFQGWGPALDIWVYDNYQAGALAKSNGTIHLTTAKLGEVSYSNKRDNYSMCAISGECCMGNSGLIAEFYSALG